LGGELLDLLRGKAEGRVAVRELSRDWKGDPEDSSG